MKAAPLLVFAVLYIIGCDETFEPIKDNADTPFSIFGYLESPADSNWVRISEVRNSLYTEKEATIDATVTVEHPESGQTEMMQDSLVPYEEGFYAFNFRSDMKFEPDQTYLLTAERSDGQTSSATVTLPSTFPDPELLIGSAFIAPHIKDVQYLADLKVIYDVHNDETGEVKEWEFQHVQDTLVPSQMLPNENLPRGEHTLDISVTPHMQTICDYYEPRGLQYTILQSQLYVASASPEWRDFAFRDSLSAQLPDGGNVKNGTGNLIGIVSKTIDMDCVICTWPRCDER